MRNTKDIREAVEAELTFDPRVDETNITRADGRHPGPGADVAVGAIRPIVGG
jgi:hypothetical protein